ncbi:hypothetical protein [Rhodopila sp.]|uniref:hypothetical protein n=1 Tax=Rhodopila sp. TaxID=2480087 RepID=UPI003D0C4402
MSNPDYMTRYASPPPAWKRLLNRNVVPTAIDAAGSLEAIIERWAIRVRTAPAQSLGLVIAASALASFLLARRRA